MNSWIMNLSLFKWIKINSYYLFIIVIIPLFIYFTNILSYINTQVSKMFARKNKPLKIVVFDLDETLGYFTELSIFGDALSNFFNNKLSDDQYYELLDTFPEFFRPDIFKILGFIHNKRCKKACHKIFIYTNNQGPKSWTQMISAYFEKKLGFPVFDHIIAAYKINGKQIEAKRTSHEKSVKDLISCTDIPANSEICFIDDLYHPLMDKENVFYINIKPYRYSLTFEEMASRYYKKILSKTQDNSVNIPVINESDFCKKIVTFMKLYNYMVIKKSIAEENTDKIVSKTLLSHLEEFLKRERLPTTRKRYNKRVRTKRYKV